MRLIDADRLIEVLDSRGYKIVSFYFGGIRKVFDTKEYIDKFLTIDPEDLRPKGKWERVIPTKSAAKWSRKVSCSICHREGYDYHRYCPNCGARMEE